MSITLTDSEWISLIDGDSVDSGLPKCCANISALRDRIIAVCRNGRTHEIQPWELDRLNQCISWVEDGHDLPPLVTRIAEQTGYAEWREKHNHKPTVLEFGDEPPAEAKEILKGCQEALDRVAKFLGATKPTT